MELSLAKTLTQPTSNTSAYTLLQKIKAKNATSPNLILAIPMKGRDVEMCLEAYEFNSGHAKRVSVCAKVDPKC